MQRLNKKRRQRYMPSSLVQHAPRIRAERLAEITRQGISSAKLLPCPKPKDKAALGGGSLERF